MKKNILLITLFIMMFFIYDNTVYAAYGDVNYRITSLEIKNANLTFNGWAFIDRTNNSSKNNQKIKIRAINKTTGEELGIKETNGSGYNFYPEFCYKSWYDGVYRCKYTDMSKVTANLSLSCTSAIDSDCHYRDIGFKISFDVDSWDLPSETEVYFQISVYNSWYGKWSSWTNVAVDTTVADKLPSSGIIKKAKLESEGIFLPDEGMFRNSYDDSTYIIKNNIKAIGQKGGTYKVVDFRPEDYSCGVVCLGIKSGYYALETESKSENNCFYPCKSSNCSTKHIVPVSWIKLNGEFTLKITNKKCEVNNKKDAVSLDCNKNNKITSECKELAVYGEEGNTSVNATVKINQTGYISNLLTPTSLYNGGGFKFGFIYRNELNWSYVSNNCTGNSSTCSSIINNKMVNKLEENFKNKIKLESVTFGDENIDGTLFNIECNESGSFTNGNTLITSCIMSLPDSILEKYTGKVNYSHSGIANIANKYYVPMNFWGTYKIRATFSGLDRLSDNSVKSDSKNKNTAWTGDWSMSLSDNQTCNINVYPLYSGKNGYNFVYRPIDINNPFPNRNPGFNWFDWWKSDINKARLKNTYNKIEYISGLGNNDIGSIKTYNKSHNYLYWDDFDDNNRSDFVSTYAKRVGGN